MRKKIAFGSSHLRAQRRSAIRGAPLRQTASAVLILGGRYRLKNFWLFRPSAAGLEPRRKVLFWIWNAAALLLAGVCLGALSLALSLIHI